MGPSLTPWNSSSSSDGNDRRRSRRNSRPASCSSTSVPSEVRASQLRDARSSSTSWNRAPRSVGSSGSTSGRSSSDTSVTAAYRTYAGNGAFLRRRSGSGAEVAHRQDLRSTEPPFGGITDRGQQPLLYEYVDAIGRHFQQ